MAGQLKLIQTIRSIYWRCRRLLGKFRRGLENVAMAYPKRVLCNVCGWQGRRFLSDSWHPYTVCPKCGSQVRQRLLIAALKYLEEERFDRIIRNKKVIHFAPEKHLDTIFQKLAGEYFSADMHRDDVDIKTDISDMKDICSSDYNVLVACDVLEHVEDDRRAMEEIFRILRPGGCAILTVPQKDDLRETFADPSVTDPEERTRLFGQFDHLRIYGDNFPEILESVGFKVKSINEKDFSADLVDKLVLFPSVLSTRELATNYRKIFFAYKPL